MSDPFLNCVLMYRPSVSTTQTVAD